MNEKPELEGIALDDLDAVGGGVSWGGVAKVGKFAAKKAGPVGVAITAYDGISAGYDSYQKGNSWGQIAKDAAWGAIW